jgi:hypothetical protein
MRSSTSGAHIRTKRKGLRALEPRKAEHVAEQVLPHDPVAERVAENQARFRAANEKISALALRTDLPRIPFVCECANPRCVEIVRLTQAEYEAIRADGRHFLNAPGHEAAALGWGVVVERRDGFVVVEKIGEAGAIAEALDPRRDGR